MATPVEFLIVGRTPLGGAIRAGLIGVVATSIATWFFSGFWGPFVVGAVVVVTVLPLAYLLSARDDRAVQPDVPPVAPIDPYDELDRGGGPGQEPGRGPGRGPRGSF